MRANLFKIVAIMAAFLLLTEAQSLSKTKILIITGGHDFEREPFFNMFSKMHNIEFTSVEHPAANSIYTTTALDHIDVLVYYDMVQDISEAEKKAFLDMVNKGKGLVFLHHSLASYQSWSDFLKIQGGRYHLEPADASLKSSYKHDVEINVSIIDRDHPVTKGISDFRIHDEVYGNFEVLPTVHPLLKTNHPESNEIIGWANVVGPSKIVYVQLGHDHFAYQNENYRQLVHQAIKWVAGQ
ncbi:ThuA domain-containing protein [candidate division KSB1 bacterium]|nr:ThuA domain-containing protein [candidate division KSB1 bacterium]